MALEQKHCEACDGETAPLHADEADFLLDDELPTWRREGDWIVRDIECKNFVAAVGLVDAIAPVAEAEGHHPDLRIHGYKHLEIRLQTHAIGGLSMNDFILAAKLERLLDA